MNYNHILVAIDFNEHSHSTLRHALVLQMLFGAKLTLVHYVKPINYGPGLAELEKEMQHKAEVTMCEWINEYKIPKVATLVTLADAKTTMHETAKEIGADLIIIGSHADKKMLHINTRSTSRAIASNAECDVFIVRNGNDRQQQFVGHKQSTKLTNTHNTEMICF